MPAPEIDFETYLKRIPAHTRELPQESEMPRRHYQRSANDAWNLLIYVERNIDDARVYHASLERHIRHLSTMVLLGLIEAFERFLKETAAVCINQVADYVVDDRLDVFSTKGNLIAAHFAENDLGRALCESLTWCDCDETNKRFRRILADPFDSGSFYVFPLPSQNPPTLRGKYELMSLVWQLRHTIAHNTGIITSSDALKFRLLTKTNVDSPRILWPTKGDVWYTKLFLDEMVEIINREVAARLAELLTILHASNHSLFEPHEKAQVIADLFGVHCTIANYTQGPS